MATCSALVGPDSFRLTPVYYWQYCEAQI